ncbi:hypothetical protein [Mycolicibacterium goodii]|uniref:Uncharacterized protein n=1 Tax=Mycolicibacterium goodii TaxID=134601 RepID=A0ABS6HSS0_MYCGD|nr:hypothetical protein [Mycolicibacterium goodii]MBU8825737.1 hypothetical protein [Mycolicibacterium goodii]MBU8829851.1 hypothetical protein [Mycolicibacterium goodii]MBU8839968.1 hypothetical protein [Mycolicibacterium goodii]
MTAYGGECGHWPYSTHARRHGMTRWQARRLSRQFAGVGVGIAAARLRELADGAPATAGELADVEFAFLATELRHDERLARVKRGRRACISCLITVGVGVLMLVSLISMVLLLFSLMLHNPPY